MKRHEGMVPSRGGPATGEGKTLKAEAQGRYRRETKPERLRAEQSVKRLRKPEGAAQPGEVTSVLVAACFCKRRRATNPMEGGKVRIAHTCGNRRRVDRHLSTLQFAMGTIATRRSAIVCRFQGAPANGVGASFGLRLALRGRHGSFTWPGCRRRLRPLGSIRHDR
jgi:hypothetical protein